MTEPICTLLEWDTEFFGHRIFRLQQKRLNEELVDGVLRRCRAESVDCLYYLAEADDAESLRVAQDAGFRLVDIRATLSWTGGEASPGTPSTFVRAAETEDIPELERIASTVHRGTRFFADPRFSGKAPSLYRTWISTSVRGHADFVLVAKVDGRPAGYVTGKEGGGGVGHIGLCGVDASARGHGLGRALVEQALRWFYEHGRREVYVVTQGRNIAARRLYERCGFLTSSVELWFHRWFDEDR